MNSEQLKEMESMKNRSEKVKFEYIENKIVGEGNAAEDFTKHPHWIRTAKKLGGIKEALREKLDSVETLKEMYKIQAEIKTITVLLNSPKGYIEKREALLRRKQTWTK